MSKGPWPAAVISVVLVMLGLMAAGCGGGPDRLGPVVVGTPKPAGTRLPIMAGAEQIIPPSSWPSVCTLLTDGELTSLLPQATELSHDRARHAREGACEYRFWLKGAVPFGAKSAIDTIIDAVGGPTLIARRYAQIMAEDRKIPQLQRLQDLGAALGPAGCFTYVAWIDASPAPADAGSNLVCHQGVLLYEVSVVGGANFAGARTDPWGYGDSWQSNVVWPVAALVAAKAPGAT